MLAQDLAGENETVECPECGNECEGRQGLKTHLQMKHEGSCDSQSPFLSEKQIHEQIASQTEHDTYTVHRLVKIGNLPDETLWLIKTQDERTPDEQDQVENKLPAGFTLSTENSSVVSQKALNVVDLHMGT